MLIWDTLVRNLNSLAVTQRVAYAYCPFAAYRTLMYLSFRLELNVVPGAVTRTVELPEKPQLVVLADQEYVPPEGVPLDRNRLVATTVGSLPTNTKFLALSMLTVGGSSGGGTYGSQSKQLISSPPPPPVNPPPPKVHCGQQLIVAYSPGI